MVINLRRFNTYLLAAAFLVTLAGCGTTSSKAKKQIATVRVHIEAGRDTGERSQPVLISRAAQIKLNIDIKPFLTELYVVKASVADAMGGFTLSIQFDSSGSHLLEQFTATNPGKHLAIYTEWGEKENGRVRWLAAPLINRRIPDGILTFTPDATRAEAEEIALGLNNTAINSGNQEKSKDQPEDKPKEKTKSE